MSEGIKALALAAWRAARPRHHVGTGDADSFNGWYVHNGAGITDAKALAREAWFAATAGDDTAAFEAWLAKHEAAS